MGLPELEDRQKAQAMLKADLAVQCKSHVYCLGSFPLYTVHCLLIVGPKATCKELRFYTYLTPVFYPLCLDEDDVTLLPIRSWGI